MKDVSFTVKVKEDVTFNTVDYTLPRKKATLAAFIKHAGYFSIRDGEEILQMTTENAKVAKYIYQLFKEIFNIEPTFSYLTNRRFGRKMKFNVVVKDHVSQIFEELQLSFLGSAVSRKIVYSDDTMAGYFTGAFLGSGSMTSPISSNYHLEIVVNQHNYGMRLVTMLSRFEKAQFTPKVSARRDKFIFYLKKSDQIAEFLIFIGATHASLEFESIRVNRDMQNITNRMFICDEANYKKTLVSSKRQTEDILIVRKYFGLTPEGNEKLAALMNLRLEHEDATLSELADLLTEVLDNPTPISKGNVNHLFIKLRNMAKPYKDKK